MCGDNTNVPDVINQDLMQYRDQIKGAFDETASPLLEENIAKQRGIMEESLSRKLGSNWQQTTPGIQSMTEFDRNANLQLQEDARNKQNQAVQNYASLAGLALQPYLADKAYAHDLALTDMQSDAQKRSDIMGLIGNVGGMGLYSYLMGSNKGGSPGVLNTVGGASSGVTATNGLTGGGSSAPLLTGDTGLIPGSNVGSLANDMAISGITGDILSPGAVALQTGAPATLGSDYAMLSGYGGAGMPTSTGAAAGAGSASAGSPAAMGSGAALGTIAGGIAAAPLLGPPITSLVHDMFSKKTAPAGLEYVKTYLTGDVQYPGSEWVLNNKPNEMQMSSWLLDMAFGPTQYSTETAKDPYVKNLANQVINKQITMDQLGTTLQSLPQMLGKYRIDPTAH